MDSFVMKDNLPSRELGLFKKVRKCYEQKQYKNGLKFTKQILSNPKFSDHGETLAMKGLFLNCLGKKDEAYENVKKGLKKDLTSFICWHTYGLLQRSDYKYDEAIKCYRKALQCNQNNIQIWRDLSALQIQMRDLEGFCESRYQLFKLRASQRTSWIGFALANHLIKEFKLAASILEEFRKLNATTKTPIIDYENSELLLYQISLYIEEGDYSKALKCSNDHIDEICDKVSLYEYQADILIKLNKFFEAVKIIKEKLLNRNPDNKLYYQMLETALNVKDNEKKRHKIYLEYQKNFPSSILPYRLPLNFLTDQDFVKHLDLYLRKSLRKGRPALFKDLKSLYKNEKNHMIIQNLLENYHTNLLQNLSFDSDPSTKCSEDLTTIVWLDYFLAQHYCHLKDYDKAMIIIDKSILQTPTLIELYVFKAKIYKRKGEITEAVECINEAQSLDTADRYLNAKCVKYMLRANMINEAEKMSSKFTREGLPPNEDLNEMQCMWYQTEVACAYYRLNNYGEALKKCYEINRHFTEMNEDQFDFHSYSMRKVTLRAYVDLLRLIDVLKSHPFYFNAAKLAIKIYLKLFDKPITDEQDSNQQTNKDEVKVNGKKSRKDKKNKENVKETDSKLKDDNKNKEKVASSVNIYSNLHCEKLIAKDLERPDNALEEAERFLKPLLLFAANRIETHLLSFEVYYRRNKFLLMLQSLKKAVKLDSENKKLNDQLKLFTSLVNEKKVGLHEYIQSVISIELKKIEDFKLGLITQKMNSITQEFV